VDWLFRRHFWIVHLAFLAVCALGLAKTVNVMVGYALAKSFPAYHSKPSMAHKSQAAPVRNFAVANDRNIFGAKREAITIGEAQLEEADNRMSSRWEDATPSSLHVKLIGTAVFSDPRSSLAAIVDLNQSTGVAVSYSINECPKAHKTYDPLLVEILGADSLDIHVPCNRLLGSATIRRIETTRVYLYNETERRYEYLALEADEPRPPPPPPAPVGAADVDSLGKGVRKVGASAYEIEGAELDAALNNLAQLSTQARMVPAFGEDGKPVGFKVFSIKPNSVFTKIGLENGDVVTRINGYEINSPEKLLELYNKMRTTNEFNLDLKKPDGQNKSYSYSVVR